MHHIIISNCTNRKSSKVEKIQPTSLMYETNNADHFIEEWFKILNSNNYKKSAVSIYKGRSVSEIIRAKNHIDAEIFFNLNFAVRILELSSLELLFVNNPISFMRNARNGS